LHSLSHGLCFHFLVAFCFRIPRLDFLKLNYEFKLISTSPDAALSLSIRLSLSKFSPQQKCLLLLPAICTSIISGVIAPFMSLVVRQAFNASAQFAGPQTPNLPSSAKSTLFDSVGIATLGLLALALGSFALASLTSCLWIWTDEHNVMALRKCVLLRRYKEGYGLV
jgi:hypothetical protein